MNKIKVGIYSSTSLSIPKYETEGAAGVDLRSTESFEITPGSTVVIPTGIYVAIPKGFEGQIRPRSGFSLKTDFVIKNSPGTIDSDYRGEIKIISKNAGKENISVAVGDRIAQLVFVPVYQAEWDVVYSISELGNTVRGVKGFGSTGSS